MELQEVYTVSLQYYYLMKLVSLNLSIDLDFG